MAALRTFTSAGVNNLWSNALNWDTAPTTGDDWVTIAAGQTCIYDAATYTMGAGSLTIDAGATFKPAEDGASHTLILSGTSGQNIAGTGTFSAGTSAAVPYGATSTFIVNFGAASKIDRTSGMSLQLFCYEPTTKYVEATATALTSATSITVGAANMTLIDAEPNCWKQGARLAVCDATTTLDYDGPGDAAANQLTYDYANRTATAIPFASGVLGAAKVIGARVYLVDRNIQFVHSFAASTTMLIDYGTSITTGDNVHVAIINSGIAVFGRMISGSTTAVTSRHTYGGVIAGCATAFYYIRNSTINTNILGGTTALSICNGCTFNGHIGSTAAMSSSSGIRIYGQIFGCTTPTSAAHCVLEATGSILYCGAVFNSSHGTIKGTIAGCLGIGVNANVILMQGCNIGSPVINNPDVSNTAGSYSRVVGHGARLQSTNQVVEYKNSLRFMQADYSCGTFLYDVADASNVPQIGQIKSWCPGGTMVSAAKYAGYPGPQSYTHTVSGEDTLAPVFCDWMLKTITGKKVNITWWVYIPAASAAWATRPKMQVIDPNYEFDAVASVLASSQCAATYDAWQTLSLTYTPIADRDLTLRFYAIGDTVAQTAYFGYKDNVYSGGRTSGRIS